MDRLDPALEELIEAILADDLLLVATLLARRPELASERGRSRGHPERCRAVLLLGHRALPLSRGHRSAPRGRRLSALLAAGADPGRPNKTGSTPLDLAQWTTGRGGSGSPEARAEQRAIIRLLEEHQAGARSG